MGGVLDRALSPPIYVSATTALEGLSLSFHPQRSRCVSCVEGEDDEDEDGTIRADTFVLDLLVNKPRIVKQVRGGGSQECL